MILLALMFFWSDKKSETTSIFNPTNPPTNKIDFNEEQDSQNLFQSSNDFSNKHSETFPPFYSQRYNTFTETPNFYYNNENTFDSQPRQYFPPTEEFTPTESYRNDEL